MTESDRQLKDLVESYAHLLDRVNQLNVRVQNLTEGKGLEDPKQEYPVGTIIKDCWDTVYVRTKHGYVEPAYIDLGHTMGVDALYWDGHEVLFKP